MIHSADLADIRSVLDGNTSAYRHLVERHQDKICHLSRSILKDPFEAEEAAHETFIKAYEKLAQFRQEAGFSTWLFRICYRTCLSRLRKAKRSRESEGIDENMLNIQDMEQGFETVVAQERKLMVQKALDMLPEEEKHILVFYYYHDMKVEEICKVTGHSTSNIKTKLYRGRKKMLVNLHKVFNKDITELL